MLTLLVLINRLENLGMNYPFRCLIIDFFLLLFLVNASFHVTLVSLNGAHVVKALLDQSYFMKLCPYIEAQ